jgi:hypothetical protein
MIFTFKKCRLAKRDGLFDRNFAERRDRTGCYRGYKEFQAPITIRERRSHHLNIMAFANKESLPGI